MSASNNSYTPAPSRLLAIGQGVDIASCLALAGLSNEDFGRQYGLIAVAQYSAFASCVARKIGVERTAGRLFELIWNLGAEHGLILLRSSRNMLDVLKAHATYARVLSVVEVEIKLSATTVEIIQHPIEEDSDFASIAFVNLMFFLRIARMATQIDINPSDMTLAFAPQNEPDFTNFLLDVATRTGPVNAMTFPLAVAEIPFLTADRQMFAGLLPQFDRRLAKIRGRRDLVDELCLAIREEISSGNVTIGKMPRSLGVGTRTL